MLADSLKAARLSAGMRLTDIGLLSAGHLSRMERCLARPTAQVVRAYEERTGTDGLYRLFTEAASADSPTSTPLGVPNSFYVTEFVVTELDALVRVEAEKVRVLEQRTIRSNVDGLAHIRINQGLFNMAGRTPALTSISAVRARLDGVQWVSANYFAALLSLPRPMERGEIQRISVEYEFDFLFPRYTFQPLVRADAFNITVALPNTRYTAYSFDGIPVIVAQDFAVAALGHQPHALRALSLDSLGTVEQRYETLLHGLCYGIMWVEGD